VGALLAHAGVISEEFTWPSGSPLKSEELTVLEAGTTPENLAHPASQNANLEPLIEGPAISLSDLHTKVRRAGYSA
jgi:hypothetical protein